MADGLLQLVESVTFVITLFLILSVLPLTRRMWSEKSTDGMPFWTFLFSFANGYMICLYATVINNNLIWSLNVLAVILYGLAVFVFISISPKKIPCIVKLLMAVSSIGYLHHYTFFHLPAHLRQEFLGPIGTVLTTVTLTAPLLDVGHFIRQKSCQGMAVFMVVSGFLCNLAWFGYGLLLKDPFVYLPNIPGILASAVYFSLMLFYGFPDVKKKQT